MCRDFGVSLLYFQSFTFFIHLPLKGKFVSAQTSNCATVTDFLGRLRGNCTSRGYTSVPQDLNPKIQILDISMNTISALNKDDLKKYPNLEGLIMRNLSVRSFPSGFFQYTPNLKMLNISKTQITNWKEIPVSINELNFTYCEFEMVDLSHLVNLEFLYMKDCRALKRVPLLSSAAPLKKLNLKFCDLSEVEYSQVSPFCQLIFFGVLSKTLTQEKHMIRCCGIRKWGLSWNISGSQGQNCAHTPEFPLCHDLDIKFDDQSLQARSDCLQNLNPSKVIWIIIATTTIFIVMFVLGVIFLVVHHYKVHLPKTQGRESSSATETEEEPEYDGNSTD